MWRLELGVRLRLSQEGMPMSAEPACTQNYHGTLDQPATPVGPAPPLPAERFILGKEIARGGMGEVYAARDTHLDRDVAVKVLQARLAGTAAERRFADEARITGQLQHPGIPPVYDLGTLPDGRPYLAMKLVKGDTLDALLKADGPGGHWLGVFEGLCQAVAYAHAHGVIHRDLKPANVMVGAFGEVQVMDWGLAKLLASRGREGTADDPEATTDVRTAIQSQRDGADLTRAGSVLGTPAYMAPEQAIGAVDRLDRRTDVFGLGAILCVMLTGKSPFVGGDAESTRQLAARGKLEDAVARLSGCGADPDLVALCVRCLSAEPAARPADAGAVAAAVAALRSAADERARSAEVDKAEGRVRRRLQLRLGGLAAMVLLTGLLTAGLLWRRAEREWVRATEREAEAVAATAREAAEKESKTAALADAVTARGKTVAALRRLTDELLTDQRFYREHRRRPAALPYQDGLTDADRVLVMDLLALWEWVAGTAGDTQEAVSVRAEGTYRTALVRRTLGDRSEAEADLRASIAMLERLANIAPDQPDYQARLADSLIELAQILKRDNPRHSEIDTSLTAALAIRTRLLAESPNDPDRRFALARGYRIMRGHWIMRGYSGGPSKAAALDASLPAERTLLKSLVTDFPSVGKYRKELISSHVDQASRHDTSGRKDDALTECRAACRQAEQLAALKTAFCEDRRGANPFDQLATYLLKAGRPQEAAMAVRDGLRLAEQLAADYPYTLECRLELGQWGQNAAELLHKTGHSAESLDLLSRVIKTLSGLNHSNIWMQARSGITDAYEERARVLVQLGRLSEAAVEWDRSIELDDYPYVHQRTAQWAIFLLRAGHIQPALVEMDKLSRHPNPDQGQRYNMGCVYATAYSAIPDRRDEFAGRAMAELRATVALGFENLARWVAKGRDFDPIRDRADFRALMNSLPEVAPPPRPAK